MQLDRSDLQRVFLPIVGLKVWRNWRPGLFDRKKTSGIRILDRVGVRGGGGAGSKSAFLHGLQGIEHAS